MKVNPKQILAFSWPILLLGGILFAYYAVGEQKPAAGQILYERHCAICHKANGEGIGLLVPPLAGADWLGSHPGETVCIIRYGNQRPILVNGSVYEEGMPANQAIKASEMTYLVNYIRQSWGNDYPSVTYEEVQAFLKACEPQP